jgi:hypothetical protein
VEDDHVDRPDVEARQRVQLTGTNRSFGLIALVAKARDFQSAYRFETENMKNQFCFTVLRRPGGLCKVIRPDPIPNSAVKRLSANGTLSQDMGE